MEDKKNKVIPKNTGNMGIANREEAVKALLKEKKKSAAAHLEIKAGKYIVVS